jgi:anti-sigma regulatory factor (Ser/Thr protein kinase)
VSNKGVMTEISSTITIADIERFHRAVDYSSSAAHEIKYGGRLSLAAASELACILAEADSHDLTKAVDFPLADCQTWSLFRRLRGPSCPKRISHASTVLLQIPQSYDERWLVAEAKRFEEGLLHARFPRYLAKSLTGAVFEMVDNVWNHSRTHNNALLGYQIGNRSFTFTVTDLGVGVLDTLTANRRFSYLKTSIEALEEAVKPNVSGKADGSGLGLDKLTRALADLWGRTRLRSGQGALTFDRESDVPKRKHQFLPSLGGFQISAICRMSPRKPKT